MKRSLIALSALILFVAPLVPANAQAGPYPALQPTRVVTREYNFALADYNGGTGLLVQWRERLSDPKMQFTSEIGILDGIGASGLSLGGSLHYQLRTADAELPFDMVVGAGLGVTASNDGNVFRIPVGVAIGHRFPLEGEFAVSPFVHPRLSLDRASSKGASSTETNLDIDVGASFEVNPRMQVRLAASFGESDAVGLSFAWMPRGLR